MAPRLAPRYPAQVRPHLLAACLALGATALTVLPPRDTFAAGDFDPSGPRQEEAGQAGPGGEAAVKKPVKPKDDDGKKGPSSDALIAKYTKIALEQPGQPFPVQKLAQLYRERDGNLKKLIEEFEKKAADGGGDQWATRVVLAGVYKNDGRYDDAIKAYEAAIAEKPKEPAAILALAQLESDRGDKAGARTHYEKALPLQKIARGHRADDADLLLALCLDTRTSPPRRSTTTRS
jgi:tetratricopeptide (TPR) repeat protein